MATATRAVRLIPIGEYPEVAVLGAEEVAAYRVVQQSTTIVNQIRAGKPSRRNAMSEASARVYAYNSFR